MFGLRIKVKCPKCKKEHVQSLGASTAYYKVNGSENAYTECICKLCGEKYWLSHTLSEAIDTKEVNGNDNLKLETIVCW